MPGSSSARERHQVEFPDHVEFMYEGDTPLSYAPEECAELDRQIRGAANDMRSVKDLIFKDVYINAARTKVLVRVVTFFNFRRMYNFYLNLTLICVCAERRKHELHHREVRLCLEIDSRQAEESREARAGGGRGPYP